MLSPQILVLIRRFLEGGEGFEGGNEFFWGVQTPAAFEKGWNC